MQVRRDYFIANSFPNAEEIREAFSDLSNDRVGKATFNYFDNDAQQSAFHYVVAEGVVKVLCKGVQNLSVFDLAKKAQVPEFTSLLSTTKTGLLMTTARKTGRSECEIVRTVYQWLAERKIVAQRWPAKCLVIESFSEILPEDVLDKIIDDVETKKRHKFAMLDQFVQLLEEYSDSQHLHQEVGLYLGVDKFKLGRIYQTLSGHMVRSKSEVIIANILFERKIPFEYEAELLIDGDQFSPDFTIKWKGKTYYWEHLGLLEQEQYKSEWEIKKAMYKKHFPGRLITTTESAVLSKTAESLVNQNFG